MSKNKTKGLIDTGSKLAGAVRGNILGLWKEGFTLFNFITT